MQRKLLIAFAFGLLTPSLVGQQKLSARRQVQSPAPSPVASAPAPLPPEQMPASPPAVEFHEGQLTIVASNSTLGDILRAVRRETGAAVDVPGNATERVVGQFGPGPARDVLASLLNGSHFNYVLLGSAQNPVNLDRVILTSRSGVNDQAAQQASGSTSQNQAIQAAMPSPQSADMDMSSDDSMEAPETVETDEPGTPGQPDDQQQQANPPGQAGGVKTPEQLLQELQQRQLQLQQQQQQQSNPNAPPIPGPQRQPQ